MMKACEKRPVSVEQMEKVATEVERELRGSQQREVSSQEIGECIMRHLLNVDQVAYVRFASVYRQFADIESFKEALESLIKNKNQLNIKDAILRKYSCSMSSKLRRYLF